jgi:hypothetical protein
MKNGPQSHRRMHASWAEACASKSRCGKNLPLSPSYSILLDVQQQVARPNFEYFRGTSVEDIRSVFARTTIDHVIMGGGLPLETRLEMVRVIFESSETTSVHMKDVASGSQGFLPFVRSVLSGL